MKINWGMINLKMKITFFALFFLLLLVACSQNATNQQETEEPVKEAEETAETEEESDEKSMEEETTPTLTDDEAVKTLNEYRDTFMRMVENTEDDGSLRDYATKEEVKTELQMIMSEQLAESYVSHYFEEDNGKLYIVPTEAPVWFEEEQEFMFEEVSETEYEVSQEQSDELIGIVRMNYMLTLDGEGWIVSEIRSEEIASENNNREEQNQNSSENDSNTNGEITAAKAEAIVREQQNIGDNSPFKVVMDHKNEDGNFVVHVYEVVKNGDTGHTATMVGMLLIKKMVQWKK